MTDQAHGAEAALAALAELDTWLKDHPETPVPTVALNIPLPPGTREEQRGALEVIARLWGMEVNDGPHETRIAARRFGMLTIEARAS